MPVTAGLIVGGVTLGKGVFDYFSGRSKERREQRNIDQTLSGMSKYRAPIYQARQYEAPAQVAELESSARGRLGNIPTGIPGQDIYEQKIASAASAAKYNISQTADNPLAATGAITDVYGRTLDALGDLNLRSAEYRAATERQRYSDYANALSNSANYGNIAQSFNANQAAMQYESERMGGLNEYQYNVLNPANIRLGIATSNLGAGQAQSRSGIDTMFSAPFQGATAYLNAGGQYPSFNRSSNAPVNTGVNDFTNKNLTGYKGI